MTSAHCPTAMVGQLFVAAPSTRKAGLGPPAFAPLRSRVALVDPLLQPGSYLAFDPADPAAAEAAEPYPLGELAGVLEALYVLVRVENEFLDLLLRQEA